jgi:hypothetical protein
VFLGAIGVVKVITFNCIYNFPSITEAQWTSKFSFVGFGMETRREKKRNEENYGPCLSLRGTKPRTYKTFLRESDS